MKSNLFNIEGKVALVTGARRGLGLAMATGLVEAGV
jgi:NAD(P)-dependent dehydrogenase (short-subunit alcohol dehydrogenase family)